MDSKRLYKFAAGLIALTMLLGACAQPTAAPAATSAPATQAPANTQAPADTQAPANTAAPADTAVPATATGGGACPAITVKDMQGVAPGAFPEQYELSEFEAAANCKLTLTSRTKFDSRLVDFGLLPKGDLPAATDRLPEEPLVVVPYDE